jgi:TP901 family phage tail tape measure protein
VPIGNNYPLSIILTAVDKASAVLSKVNAKIGSVGKSATKVGRSLTTGVTLPIVGIGAAATKMSVDFEKGMSDVSTLIDTNTESIDAMGNEVLRIAKDTPVAIEDLTSALFDVRSAGVSAADQFTVLEGSAQLAVSGLGSTKEAVDLVTSATNAFGLEGDEVAATFDTIFKTTKFGKTTISELSKGFGAVAGQVAATGTPLDEYLATVSALTTTGMKASQAHTQMRAVISGLTRDTSQTRKVFGALGAKDFKDLIKQSGGLVNAVRAVSKQVGGNEGQILKLVGSTEALNAILGITGSVADTVDESLGAMRDGSNEARKAFEKQNRTTAAVLQRTKNTLQATAVTIGNALAPHLERLSELIRDAANWFAGLDETTRGWIVTAAGIAAVLGPVLLVFGKIATIVGVIGAPLAAAIALLVTAAGMIIAEWEHFEAFFKLLWDGVVDVFEWAWSKIEPIIDGIRDGAKAIKDAHKAAVDFFVSDDNGTVPLRARRRVAPPSPAAAAGAPGNANITIDFQNMQPGVRTHVESDDRTNVDVSAGIPVAPLL